MQPIVFKQYFVRHFSAVVCDTRTSISVSICCCVLNQPNLPPFGGSGPKVALAADKSSWRRGEPQCHLSSLRLSFQCGCERQIDSIAPGNLIAGDVYNLGTKSEFIDQVLI